MKLKKLLEINAMCEEQQGGHKESIPWDVQESFNYDSNSLGLTDILEMDIIHFIRAFKLLNKKTTDYNLNAVRPSKVALNLIAGKLHIAVNELEEYINNE
tara:strand:+ start:304 stop:603 length:300 start_codon:yes stop_codon:yes gene_type:complete